MKDEVQELEERSERLLGDQSQSADGGAGLSVYERRALLWLIILCLAPFLLNLLNLDFGTSGDLPDYEHLQAADHAEQVDTLHHSLCGSFTHTLLEWSAFCTALFTVILAFTRYILHGDHVTALLGMALFCAGCMDAFHTLAADRLIHAIAPNEDLIPFSWAICRLFNALILLGGVLLAYMPFRVSAAGRLRFVLLSSLGFVVLAYGVIHACATSASLPQTMYPDKLITRPWDVAPLILFLIGGVFAFPALHRRIRSFFSFALCLSAIPQIATQVHMAFGSAALFDNHFNVAHFLKILAYFVPFCGLVVDYAATYRRQRDTSAAQIGKLNRKLRELVRHRTEELGERVKELTYMHRLHELVDKPSMDFSAVCREAVKMIPAAFHHPAATFARLSLPHEQFMTEPFRETAWRIAGEWADVSQATKTIRLEVFVDDEEALGDSGFLPEEQELIDSAVKALGSDYQRRYRAERYNLIAAADAVWDWDVPRHKVRYSPSWKALRGYGPEELSDSEEEWSSSIHPDDLPRVMEAVYEHFDGRTDVFRSEYRVRCKDGSYRWVQDRGTARRDTDGNVVRMAGMETDITERKEAEEALQQNRERLRNAQTIARMGDFTWNSQTGAVTWSDGLYRLLGYDPEENIDFERVAREVHHPEDRERINLWLRETMESEVTELPPNEYRVVHRDGSSIHVHTTGVIRREGEAKILVGTVMDVSELEVARSALAEHAKRLERSNEELEQFAYVASHDLRSPLRGIENLANWIEEDSAGQLNEESLKHLELMRQRVTRMEGLLLSLLDYSRVGRMEDEISAVDLNELLADLLEIQPRPTGFEIEVPDDLPTLKAPRGALNRIFGNLISNAIKHHDREDGRVRLAWRPLGDEFEFVVADDGPGIAPEFHERIFGMFQTLQPRDRAENTGMGLALVKKTIEHLGGRVTLSSEPGQGAEFTVVLPGTGGAAGRGLKQGEA